MVEQTRSQSITDAASRSKYRPCGRLQPGAGTIDETIQYICGSGSWRPWWREREPDKAGILVMEPKTGRVLAMAEYPTYDPNNFADYPWWRAGAIC